MSARTPELSVVVPALNEEGSVAALVRQVAAALEGGPDWELILVDDGSTDGTADVFAAHASTDKRLKLVRLARRYGQSTAMQAGFDAAQGATVVTLDGDLQNDPADIPRLTAKLAEGYDLVVGYRVRRKDGPLRRIPSRIANALIRWATDVSVRDHGCSLKAYRRQLLDSLTLYSDMHRFIPPLAAAATGARTCEIPVNHRPRTSGSSKYGLSRIFPVMIDLLTVKVLSSFRDRPLFLFTIPAMIGVGAGVLATVVTVLSATVGDSDGGGGFVFPGVALLCFAQAGFMLLSGLIAEHAVRSAKAPRPQFVIERVG